MELLKLAGTNPAHNLATEEYVFDCMDPGKSYFMLWQNESAVIIGKNQNALAEINNDFVRAQGIPVVRRLSGGGAVYHDLGNLNFSYITDAEESGSINFLRFCEPVQKTLAAFGANAIISGRNDILLAGKKISGNAQYVRRGRVMHHGTLLFCSDLSMVERTLYKNKEAIESNGVPSVISRVTNISDHLEEDVALADFVQKFLSVLSETQPLHQIDLTQKDSSRIAEIEKSRYGTWEWNYGHSPAYTINRKKRFEGVGQVEVSLSVENGVIKGIQLFGDFFGNLDADALCSQLKDCPFRRESVAQRLSQCDVNAYIWRFTGEQLAELIVP